MRVLGTVAEWYDEDGWGVFHSDATPGGCWVHISDVRGPLGPLAVGSPVGFDFEEADQVGFRFRALVVVPEGVGPDDDRTVHGRPGRAYSSSLTITFEDPELPVT